MQPDRKVIQILSSIVEEEEEEEEVDQFTEKYQPWGPFLPNVLANSVVDFFYVLFLESSVT